MLNNRRKRAPWVNFVASQPLVTATTSTSMCKPSISPSGEEASAFYRCIINQPSRKKVTDNSRTRVIVKRPVNPPYHKFVRKPSDFLKFAEIGDLNGIQECLSQGLDINLRDLCGWTPLMCAACAGHELTVTFLLKNGANVNFVDRSGNHARDLALQHNHTNVIKLLIESDSKDTFEMPSSNTSNSSDKTNLKTTNSNEYFCEFCQTFVQTPKAKHESSIIHNLNSNNMSNKTVYQIPNSNAGYKMMLRSGWDENNGLGPYNSGNKYPIKTLLKQDRKGLGMGEQKKPRVTHFKPFDTKAVQRKSSNSTNIYSLSGKTNKKQRLKKERREKKTEINFRREFYE